jgi:hypothetical protein
MNRHTFSCFDEHGDKRQYVRTVEALEQFTKKMYKFSDDFASLYAFEPSMPQLDKPKPPLKENRDEADELIFKEEIKQYVNCCAVLKDNLAAIWSVAIGQCTKTMKAKLESLQEYEQKHTGYDCNWLLKSILSITLQFDRRRYGYLTLMEAQQRFLTCKQAPSQTVEAYQQQLTLWSDTIEHHGGTIVANYMLADAADSGGNVRSDAARREVAKQETLAMALLRGADQSKFGTLLDHLSNQYASGQDEYPKDLTSAYSLLVHYRTPTNVRTLSDNNSIGGGNTTDSNQLNRSFGRHEAPAAGESAMTFAQRGGTNRSSDGTADPSQGGYSVNVSSPSADSTASGGGVITNGTTRVQHAVMMAQAEMGTIDPTWILLDSQSTISVFKKKDMLRNIRRAPHVLRAITNGGYQDSNMVGDFPNLSEVWYNAHSIANILSLADVREVCTVTMDSSLSPSMNVHRKDGSIMSFVEHPSGLYIYKGNDCSDRVTAYTLLTTVADHKRMFSQRQIREAARACKLYHMIGRPDEKLFQFILRNNLILNCPVTPDDASRALTIYGPDVATLKGKMTRGRAVPHVHRRASAFAFSKAPQERDPLR